MLYILIILFNFSHGYPKLTLSPIYPLLSENALHRQARRHRRCRPPVKCYPSPCNCIEYSALYLLSSPAQFIMGFDANFHCLCTIFIWSMAGWAGQCIHFILMWPGCGGCGSGCHVPAKCFLA